jgi:hypothetical protein
MGINYTCSRSRQKVDMRKVLLTCLSLTFLSSCIGPGSSSLPKGLGRSGDGSQISRTTDPKDCPRVTPHAQNIIIAWARQRKIEGRSVSTGTAAALMGLGRYESGGGKGLNFANVTSHGNEARTNREGWNGSSFGQTSAVENFISRYKPSHETNFGGLQISPNVVVNYRQEANFQNFINKQNSPSGLYTACLTDMGYADKSNAMKELADLFAKKDQISGWLTTLRNFTAKSQATCKSNAGCTHASAQIGRWLAYCPKLNLDMAAVVYNTAPHYYGARRHYPGRNPKICMDMIGKEIHGPFDNFRDETGSNQHAR